MISIEAARVLELIHAVSTAPSKLAHIDNYAAVKKQTLRARGLVIHHMAGTLSGTTAWFGMGRAQRQEGNDREHVRQKREGPAPRAFVSSAHAGVGGTRRADNSVDVHTYVHAWWKAYHAGGALRPVQGGAPIMRHGSNPNDYTIGIEHETNPRDMIAQMQTSAVLIVAYAYVHRFDINAETIVPHSALANTACPGAINVRALIELAQAARVEILSNESFNDQLKLSQQAVLRALDQL